jgi:hypothetical protein
MKLNGQNDFVTIVFFVTIVVVGRGRGRGCHRSYVGMNAMGRSAENAAVKMSVRA